MARLPDRPETAAERSNSFILSIDAKWMTALRDGSLTCLIRKRLPYGNDVEEAYFHAKSPISSLFGRARVISIQKISVLSAIACKNELQMSEGDIKDYTKGLSEISIMHFKCFESIAEPVSMKILQEALEYFAPQSFSFISRAALPQINYLCRF